MTTAQDLKARWKQYEEAKAESDRIDSEWERDPMNREIEKRWDIAYRAEYNTFQEVVKTICELTGVQEHIAYLMVTQKPWKIKALLARAE